MRTGVCLDERHGTPCPQPCEAYSLECEPESIMEYDGAQFAAYDEEPRVTEEHDARRLGAVWTASDEHGGLQGVMPLDGAPVQGALL